MSEISISNSNNKNNKNNNDNNNNNNSQSSNKEKKEFNTDKQNEKEKENSILNKYKLEKPYDSLNEEEKKEIFKRLDNFLECIYLCPTVFPNDILSALKFREDKLSYWRFSGQLFGGISFSALWGFYKLRFYPCFYFRNIAYYLILLGISSYSFGRLFEFQANIRYYREMILKMSNDYNISDDEVLNLHQQMQEFYLKENQKKTSIENVKFKL
jgi:hypothetical protein